MAPIFGAGKKLRKGVPGATIEFGVTTHTKLLRAYLGWLLLREVFEGKVARWWW